jgi:hypothetical protein
MRVARRLISLLLLIGVAVALVNFYGWPQQWLGLQVGDLTRLIDRRATSVSPESLPSYTRTVAGKPWFQSYFTRLAFSDEAGTGSFTGRLTKWDKRRVRIDVLNSGGPGMGDYVQSLVRRLNRMQSATRFTVADGAADITIEYVSHAEYARTLGPGSVGNCETRFYSSAPGLISAAITIDAGVLRTPAERKPVVIHELTHALGFKGHFREPRYRTRSVLYYAASLTNWSQNDGAAIRIMYSSSMKNGMSASAARKALRRIPS